MPRPDSAEPAVRCDSRDYARAYSSHSPGQQFRVGQRAARSLQKGDLPSSGERAIFIWSKVAGARNPNGKRPGSRSATGVRVPRPAGVTFRWAGRPASR